MRNGYIYAKEVPREVESIKPSVTLIVLIVILIRHCW